MKIASVAAVKSQLSRYLKHSAHGPVVVTRNGRPVAILLGVADEDELERLVLAYSPKLRRILDAARQRIREGAGIPREEFWKDVEKSRKPRKKGR
jgi:prevent-host-death family protein